MSFHNLQTLIYDNFQLLIKDNIPLKVDASKDELWDTYLSSFPEDIRQKYNCNCCKSFIKQAGGVVVANPLTSTIKSIWDININDPIFKKVVKNMGDLVKSKKINRFFVSKYEIIGTKSNVALSEKWIGTIFEHFYIDVPTSFVRKTDKEAYQGRKQAIVGVFNRSLKEYSLTLIEDVIELIEGHQIAQGSAYLAALKGFREIKTLYDPLDSFGKELFPWVYAEPVLAIRNTVIGTLLSDLADGMNIETAINSYNKKVDPFNYHRPKKVVTASMLDNAKKQLTAAGLLPSLLSRRQAVSTDISINDTLFVNRYSLSTDFLEVLSEGLEIDKNKLKGAKSLSLSQFIKNIVPTAKDIKLLLSNDLESRVVSLVAPEDTSLPNPIKWDNGVTWSYPKGLTSAIKERVKSAGGAINGILRASLSWNNTDDLDLSIEEPNGNRIFFGNKQSKTSGTLDIDMNALSNNIVNDPVENIIFTDPKKVISGKYIVKVTQYNKRGTNNIGFQVEIEAYDQTFVVNFPKPLGNKETIIVAEFEFDIVKGLTNFKSKLDQSSYSVAVNIASLESNRWQKVNIITNSPNYWGNNSVGNKHTFFLLEGAKAQEKPRSIFNEFIKSSILEQNKAALELIGGKLEVTSSPDELTGIGVTDTEPFELFVLVKGKGSQVFKITNKE